MKFPDISLKKALALLIAGVIFYEALAIPLSEASIWEDRKSAQQSLRESERKNIELARLPATFQSLPVQKILNQLPAIKGHSLTSPIIPNALNTKSPDELSALSRLMAALPANLGTVRKISVPPSQAFDRVVVLIHDVHQNREAQKNISQVISGLVRTGDVKLVGLEGAVGSVDFSNFLRFPFPELLKTAADYLLDKNEIQGPVHAGLTTSRNGVAFVGVDDEDQYEANVDAYRRSSPAVKERKAALERLWKDLEADKLRAFNPALSKFDAIVQSHRSGKIELGQYVKRLNSFLQKQNGGGRKAAALFLEALKLESSLNFQQVEAERAYLLRGLVEKLAPSQIEELLSASAQFKAGQIRQADFYQYLKGICRQANMDLSRTPAMKGFLEYVLLAERIDAEELFRDISAMEDQVFQSLAVSDEEEELVRLSKYYFLLGRLLDFSLSSDEWAQYKKLAPSQNRVDQSSFEAFYLAAERRDALMSANLLRALNQNDVNGAVLVTGGFHADGMVRELNKNHVAVVSFVPKISRVNLDEGVAYLSIFTQEKTPLEKLFEGKKLFVPQKAWTSPIQFKVSVISMALGLMKGRIITDAKKLTSGIRPMLWSDALRWFKGSLPGASIEVTASPSAGSSQVIAARNLNNGYALQAQVQIKGDGTLAVEFSPSGTPQDAIREFYGRFVRSPAVNFVDAVNQAGHRINQGGGAAAKYLAKGLKEVLVSGKEWIAAADKPLARQMILTAFLLLVLGALYWGWMPVVSAYFLSFSSVSQITWAGWLTAKATTFAWWFFDFSGRGIIRLTVIGIVGYWIAAGLSQSARIGGSVKETEEWVKGFQRSADLPARIWGASLHAILFGLPKSMYSFGFERTIRLYNILIGRQAQVREQNELEALFGRLPMFLQLPIFPFVVALSFLHKRVVLMIKSSISRLVLLTLISLPLYFFAGASAPAIISLIMGFNVLAVINGQEWFEAVMAHGGLKAVAVQLFNVMGILNSYMLTLILSMDSQYKVMRRVKGMGRWKAFVESRKFWKPLLDSKGNPQTNPSWLTAVGKPREIPMWLAAFSAFSFEGVHMVNLEVEGVKELGHLFSERTGIHGVQVAIDDVEVKVLGAGHEASEVLLGGNPIDQLARYIPGTGGRTESELAEFRNENFRGATDVEIEKLLSLLERADEGKVSPESIAQIQPRTTGGGGAGGGDDFLRAMGGLNPMQMLMAMAMLGAAPGTEAPKIDTALNAGSKVEVARLPSGDGVMKVDGEIWSGAPGFVYQPTPNGFHINQFETGSMAALYKALLPPGGEGIDPQKYPDLVRLAQTRIGAPAQDHARILAENGTKVIRTYNLSATTESDLRMVSRIFEWMNETRGIKFIAGMYNPVLGDIQKMARVLKDNPGLLMYDGWNEIDQRGGDAATFREIDLKAGYLKRLDPNHPVGVVVSQNIVLPRNAAQLEALRATRFVDVVGVTVYHRDGANTTAFMKDLNQKLAPKLAVISEIGVETGGDPNVRENALVDIAKALTNSDASTPSAVPFFTWFEFVGERWKGADDKWDIFSAQGATRSAFDALGQVHRQWQPLMMAGDVKLEPAGGEKPQPLSQGPVSPVPQKAEATKESPTLPLLVPGDKSKGAEIKNDQERLSPPPELSDEQIFSEAESIKESINIFGLDAANKLVRDSHARSWSLVKNKQGDVLSIDIYGFQGKMVARLVGNIKINGQPVEKINYPVDLIQNLNGADNTTFESDLLVEMKFDERGIKSGEKLFGLKGKGPFEIVRFPNIVGDGQKETVETKGYIPFMETTIDRSYRPAQRNTAKIDVKDNNGHTWSDIYTKPGAEEREVKLLERHYPNGDKDVFSNHVLNTVACQWIPGHVEIFRDGELREVRNIRIGSDGKPLIDEKGRGTYDVQTYRWFTAPGTKERKAVILANTIETFEGDGQLFMRLQPNKVNPDLLKKLNIPTFKDEIIMFDVERQRDIYARTGEKTEIPVLAYALDDSGHKTDLARFDVGVQLSADPINPHVLSLELIRHSLIEPGVWHKEEYQRPETADVYGRSTGYLRLRTRTVGQPNPIHGGENVLEEKIYYEDDSEVPSVLREAIKSGQFQSSHSKNRELGRISFLWKEDGQKMAIGHSISKGLATGSLYINDPEIAQELDDYAVSERTVYGYSTSNVVYPKNVWIEFNRGDEVYARLDPKRGVLSIKRDAGAQKANPNLNEIEKSGWNEYKFSHGTNRWEFESYSVNEDSSEIRPVVAGVNLPERIRNSLSEATKAFRIYKVSNPADPKSQWTRDVLLDDWGNELAAIKADDLYFDPNKKVIDINSFPTTTDKFSNRPDVKVTYELFPAAQGKLAISKSAVGISQRQEPASVINLASNPHLQKILGDPSIGFFEIRDLRRGQTWWSFFDSFHEDEPLARVKGEGSKTLEVITYIRDLSDEEKLKPGFVTLKDLQPVVSQTYEMIGADVGREIYRGKINLDLKRDVLARHLAGAGNNFSSIAAIVRSPQSTIFDIQPLYPQAGPNGELQPVNSFTSIFNKYQEVVKIDSKQARISLGIFDEEAPWKELGGLTYHYTGAEERDWDLLAVSFNLAKDTNFPITGEGENGNRVFVIDRGLNVPFIEHRSITDGVVFAKDEGEWRDGSGQGFLRTNGGRELEDKWYRHFERALKQFADGKTSVKRDVRSYQAAKSNLADFSKNIEEGFEKLARLRFEYGSFTNTNPRASVKEFSASYLRSMSIPVQTKAYLYYRDDTDRLRLRGNGIDDETSSSTLFDLLMEPGKGMRIKSFRHSEGRFEGELLATDRIEIVNEDGIKIEVNYGRLKGAFDAARAGDANWVYRNFITEMIFRSFFVDNGPGEKNHQDLKRFRIANKTMSTVVEDGEEYLYQKSNSTKKDDLGRVTYKTQRGFSATPIDVNKGGDEFDVYEQLRQRHAGIHLDAITGSFMEQKSNRGFLLSIKDGYRRVGKDGYVIDREDEGYDPKLDDPQFIYFLRHWRTAGETARDESPFEGGGEILLYHEGVPYGSDGYRYKPGFASSDNSDFYSEYDRVSKMHELKVIADGGLSFLYYDAEDRRFGGSKKGMGFRTDGRPFFEDYWGKLENPYILRTYYSGRSIPVYTTGLDRDEVVTEVWRQFSHTYYRDGDDVYFIIFEEDNARGILERFFYPHPGWIVYKNGVFLAKAQEWDYLSEEYRAKWNYWDGFTNGLLRGLLPQHVRAGEVNEAQGVVDKVKDQPKVSETLPPELREKVNAWPRWFRLIQVSAIVAGVLGGVFLIEMLVWWALKRLVVKPFNVNEATFKTLKQIFSPQDASRVVTYLRKKIVVHSWEEFERDVANKELVLRHTTLEKIKKYLLFESHGGVAEAQIGALQKVVNDRDLNAFSGNSILAPILPQIQSFLAARSMLPKGGSQPTDGALLTEGKVFTQLSRILTRVRPGAISADSLTQLILRELYRAAYWDDLGVMKDEARDMIRWETRQLAMKTGLDLGDWDNNFIIESFIKHLAVSVPMDRVMPFQDFQREPVANPNGMWIVENLVGWQAFRLEDLFIRSIVVPLYMPFMNTNMPGLTWYARQIKQRLTEGKTADEVKQFLEYHSNAWYQILKNQLDQTLEPQRDPRLMGSAYEDADKRSWKFILKWGEMNDAFRYLLLESDIEPDGQLPKSLQDTAEFQASRKKFQDFLKDVGEGKWDGAEQDRRKNLKPADIRDIVKDNIEGLVLGVRKYYGIPRNNREWGNSTGFPILAEIMFYVFLLKSIFNKRFFHLAPSFQKTLRYYRASFFWCMTTGLALLFALGITIFLAIFIGFMPIPFADAVVGYLPPGTRVFFVLLSLSPLIDMFYLTFYGISNLNKWFVRTLFLGPAYRMATVRSFGKALQKLPMLLREDPARLDMFEMIVKRWFDHFWVKQAERDALLKAIDTCKRAFNTEPHEKIDSSIKDLVEEIKKIELADTRKFFKDWVNKFFRYDIPAAPDNLDELRSLSHQVSGFSEEPFWGFKKFNEDLSTAPEVKQTQLGMVASAYSGQFRILINRLETENGSSLSKEQKAELFQVMREPRHQLKLFDGAPAQQAIIERFMNLRLNSGLTNIEGALNVRDSYRYFIEKFVRARYPQLSNDDVRSRVEKILEERLQFIINQPLVSRNLRNFLRNRYKQFSPQSPYSQRKSWSLNHFLDEIKTSGEFLPAEAMRPEDAKSPEFESFRRYAEFLTANDVMLIYGALPGKADVHDAKYNDWIAGWIMIRGEVLMSLDWDHRHRPQESWILPNLGREWELNPALGVGPYKSEIFTGQQSMVGNGMQVAEDGWFEEQAVKNGENGGIGADGAYGKFFARVAAVRNAEALPGEFVAEDIETAFRILTVGGDSQFFHYFVTDKGLPIDFVAALKPLRKWSGDAPESLAGATPIKFLFSPRVHWTQKIDNIVSFGFYLKKPSVVRVTALVLIVFYFFNLNPWAGLPFMLFLNSLVLAQSISYGAWQRYADDLGYIRGTARFLRIFPVIFLLATSITPQYGNSVKKGFDWITRFIRTGGKGGAPSRTEFRELYQSAQYSVMPGVLLSLMVVVSSFDPIKFSIWLPQIATVFFGWWLAPFLLNPVPRWREWRSKAFYADRLENLYYGLIRAPISALLDGANNLPLFLKKIFPWMTLFAFFEFVQVGYLMSWIYAPFIMGISLYLVYIVDKKLMKGNWSLSRLPAVYRRNWSYDYRVYDVGQAARLKAEGFVKSLAKDENALANIKDNLITPIGSLAFTDALRQEIEGFNKARKNVGAALNNHPNIIPQLKELTDSLDEYAKPLQQLVDVLLLIAQLDTEQNSDDAKKNQESRKKALADMKDALVKIHGNGKAMFKKAAKLKESLGGASESLAPLKVDFSLIFGDEQRARHRAGVFGEAIERDERNSKSADKLKGDLINVLGFHKEMFTPGVFNTLHGILFGPVAENPSLEHLKMIKIKAGNIRDFVGSTKPSFPIESMTPAGQAGGSWRKGEEHPGYFRNAYWETPAVFLAAEILSWGTLLYAGPVAGALSRLAAPVLFRAGHLKENPAAIGGAVEAYLFNRKLSISIAGALLTLSDYNGLAVLLTAVMAAQLTLWHKRIQGELSDRLEQMKQLGRPHPAVHRMAVNAILDNLGESRSLQLHSFDRPWLTSWRSPAVWSQVVSVGIVTVAGVANVYASAAMAVSLLTTMAFLPLAFFFVMPVSKEKKSRWNAGQRKRLHLESLENRSLLSGISLSDLSAGIVNMSDNQTPVLAAAQYPAADDASGAELSMRVASGDGTRSAPIAPIYTDLALEELFSVRSSQSTAVSPSQLDLNNAVLAVELPEAVRKNILAGVSQVGAITVLPDVGPFNPSLDPADYTIVDVGGGYYNVSAGPNTYYLFTIEFIPDDAPPVQSFTGEIPLGPTLSGQSDPRNNLCVSKLVRARDFMRADGNVGLTLQFPELKDKLIDAMRDPLYRKGRMAITAQSVVLTPDGAFRELLDFQDPGGVKLTVANGTGGQLQFNGTAIEPIELNGEIRLDILGAAISQLGYDGAKSATIMASLQPEDYARITITDASDFLLYETPAPIPARELLTGFSLNWPLGAKGVGIQRLIKLPDGRFVGAQFNLEAPAAVYFARTRAVNPIELDFKGVPIPINMGRGTAPAPLVSSPEALNLGELQAWDLYLLSGNFSWLKYLDYGVPQSWYVRPGKVPFDFFGTDKGVGPAPFDTRLPVLTRELYPAEYSEEYAPLVGLIESSGARDQVDLLWRDVEGEGEAIAVTLPFIKAGEAQVFVAVIVRGPNDGEEQFFTVGDPVTYTGPMAFQLPPDARDRQIDVVVIVKSNGDIVDARGFVQRSDAVQKLGLEDASVHRLMTDNSSKLKAVVREFSPEKPEIRAVPPRQEDGERGMKDDDDDNGGASPNLVVSGAAMGLAATTRGEKNRKSLVVEVLSNAALSNISHKFQSFGRVIAWLMALPQKMGVKFVRWLDGPLPTIQVSELSDVLHAGGDDIQGVTKLNLVLKGTDWSAIQTDLLHLKKSLQGQDDIAIEILTQQTSEKILSVWRSQAQALFPGSKVEVRSFMHLIVTDNYAPLLMVPGQNKQLAGRVKFLIEKDADMPPSFLRHIHELSRMSEYRGLISVQFVLGFALSAPAYSIPKLDDLMNPKLLELIGSQS